MVVMARVLAPYGIHGWISTARPEQEHSARHVAPVAV